ncbi:MAG: aminoglycoside phosphotransferase family protein, partial [Paracoccaceae bacterium]|nr:aminoglycoside phosphotransferase family protein [Paracoccaceae bacterium]
MQPGPIIPNTTRGTDVPHPLIREVLAHNPALTSKEWMPLQGGRSNRLWRVGDWVVKLYDPAAASPLFPNDPTEEAHALRRFGPVGLAPILRAEGQGWLAYDHVAGRIWAENPAPVAEALARLHQLPVEGAGFRVLPSGSDALAAQATRIAAACQGSLPFAPPSADVAPVQHPCLIHGDAVAGNMIVGHAQLTMIDWQCPASGDATEDIAAFLSPAMQWLYRGTTLCTAEIETFLAAYPDPHTVARYRRLAPAFHWRMAAHCLWKAERGAPDYATALRQELAAL